MRGTTTDANVFDKINKIN